MVDDTVSKKENGVMDEQSPLGGPLELPGGENVPRVAPPRTPRIKNKLKKIVVALAMICIIGGLVFGVTLFFKDDVTNSNVSPDQSGNQTAESANASTDVPEVTETKAFSSTLLGVDLTHPSTWTITEADGGIKLESAEFTYTTVNQGQQIGNFRVYIRKGARDVDGKYIGKGVATQKSEKLIYTKPTSSQRTETNLSFFGIDSPDSFGYFMVAGNFELEKGETLGPDYGKESDTYIVMGGYSSKSLTDDFATNSVALDKYQQTNAYKQAIDIIKSLRLT